MLDLFIYMANNTPTILATIAIFLSFVLFIFPVILGDSYSIVYFFLISFVFLIVALISSSIGLSKANKENDSKGLVLFCLVFSIVFLLFLVVGALIQLGA